MSQEDAERPERHADAERRTIVTIIVAHAQRGNAVLDALRRKMLAPVAKASDGVILRV